MSNKYCQVSIVNHEQAVLPVAAKLGDKDGGIAFLKINSQLMSAESYAQLRIERVKVMPEARRVEKLISVKLVDVSAKVISARMILVDGMLFHGLATYLSRPSGIPQKVFVQTLVDGITAVLAA